MDGKYLAKGENMKKIIVFILCVIFIFAMSLSFIAVRADYQSSNNSRFRVSPQKLADIQAVLNGETTWYEIRLSRIYNFDSEVIEYYEESNEEYKYDNLYIEDSYNLESIEHDFLAKLLYAEAGSMCWEGQVYVCSAILNLCEDRELTIEEAGHNEDMFSVASYVDSVEPMQMQYDVINYVLSGGRISDIKYFQCGWYHDFGTPVCNIENVYFSM